MADDDLTLGHRLRVGQGRSAGSPGPGRGVLPILDADLGARFDVDQRFAFGRQVDDDGREDLLAGPQRHRFDDGRRQQLRLGAVRAQTGVHQLLIVGSTVQRRKGVSLDRVVFTGTFRDSHISKEEVLNSFQKIFWI